MPLKVIAVLVLIVGFFHNSYAQTDKYQFSQLDINNGLSHNQVNCIYKDQQGFMWFGTSSGLNRYDGYSFKIFKHNEADKASINDDYIVNIYGGPQHTIWIETHNGFCIYDPSREEFNSNLSPVLRSLKLPLAAIRKIKKDSKGNFWFFYDNAGVYRYNEASRRTYHYDHSISSHPSLYANNVVDLAEDSKGNVWLVYDIGVIETMDSKFEHITYKKAIITQKAEKKAEDYVITIDKDNDVWLYAPAIDMGIYYLNPKVNTIKHIDKETIGSRLNSNNVTTIVQADDDGLIWIAADHGGINVLDKHDFRINYIMHREDDPKSLKQNSALLYKDNSGIIWAGTYKEGISYYHKSILRFPLYRHFASDPRSLSFEDVDKFAEDKAGNLWIGTNGGGLIYFNRKTGIYRQYKHDPENSNSLSNDIIVSLCIDHDQKLWIGTYFGGIDSFDGKTFTHYRHKDNVPSSIADDRIYSIIEDSSHKLWVGTFEGGLDVFDPSTGIFHHRFDQTQIRSPYVSSVYEDKAGNIWVGGIKGMDKITKKTAISFIMYIM